MRSESWTFIWHPKVRMQAVLLSPIGVGFCSSAPRAPGFFKIRTGATFRGTFRGVFRESLFRASLIVFLRLVYAGSQGDLSRAALQLDVSELEVTRPRSSP